MDKPTKNRIAKLHPLALILFLVFLIICCKDKKKQTITEQLQIDGVIKDNLGKLYVENNQLTFEIQCFYSDVKEKDKFYVINEFKIKFIKLIDMNLDTISLGKLLIQIHFIYLV